jgi:indole-3-glycerol phosphate synthase
VKRVSPALGVLATTTLDVAEQGRRYEAAGAAAISVLTEPRFWGGSLADLKAVREATDVPILCKDVIVDEHQIFEARAAGADAILLIAEVLSDDELRRFRDRATELSMGTLVEAHEPAAFGRAVACGSMVVGVNARNLRRPQEIDIGRARQLHSFARDTQILVAESGIASADDARLLPARVDAVLVGTALMREPDPAPLIGALTSIARTRRLENVEVKP